MRSLIAASRRTLGFQSIPFPSSASLYHHCKNLHTSHVRLGLVNFNLADIGEGIAEVELLRWHKEVGERIEEMEGICEVQSDKAAVEITSRYTGVLKSLRHKVGDLVKIGDVLVTIETEGDEGEAEAQTPAVSESIPSSPPSQPPACSQTGGSVTAVPAARRLAKELGIDLSKIRSDGQRISKQDVELHAKRVANGNTETATPEATTALPQRPQRENTDVALKGFSRAMVKSMSETAKVPHLNIGEEFDVTALMAARESLKKVAEKKYGMKLTLTPLLIKAMSLALNEFPILNSKLVDENKYTLYGSHNVSVAIDTPNGLVVPNIKNVQDLTVLEIQSELKRLQELAMASKLSSADLTGGTICISNVGVIGGTYVKALLFDGQALILGIGRTQLQPKFDLNQNVVPRNIMTMGFSADHRHCDGATVARYISALKSYIENPSLMLLRLT